MRGGVVLGGLALLAAVRAPARAQGPPPSPPPAAAPGVKEGNLAERLQAVEAVNKELVERLERAQGEAEVARRDRDEQMRLLMRRIDDLSTRLPEASPPALDPADMDAAGVGGLAPAAPGAGALLESVPEYSGPVPEYETQPLEPNPFHADAPGLSTIANPPRRPLESNFGPGFQFQTRDEEFLLQVHVQSQIEARVWGDSGGGAPYQNGFFFPRQRIFFNGRMTRPIEYVFSMNRGLGSFDILESFLNLHRGDRLQIRFGRYFTPMGYDQYAVRNLWLPTPERSLFTTNLGPGRQIGLMAWGYLFDKRLDYAAGLFTGPRNSFEDRNVSKDFTGYLNMRPFQNSERFEFLKDFNAGASIAYGYQDQPAVPLAFRVGAVGPTNAEQAALAAAPFLTLNPDVRERGERLLGGVHSAYFRNGLSLIGEWNYGYGGYASPLLGTSAVVPFSAWYVTAAHFLTGEHVDRRTVVVPRRPVAPTSPDQRRGIGAWELVGRVSQLTLGRQIFDAGLADPDLWANSATTYEAGVNWYWNEHLKVYVFWLHGHFDDPVHYGANDSRDDVNMFWMRFQLYY